MVVLPPSAAVGFPSLLVVLPEMSLMPESAFGCSIDSKALHSLFFWLSADLENPPTALLPATSVSLPSLKFASPKPNESSLAAAAEEGEDEEGGGVCFCFGGCRVFTLGCTNNSSFFFSSGLTLDISKSFFSCCSCCDCCCFSCRCSCCCCLSFSCCSRNRCL